MESYWISATKICQTMVYATFSEIYLSQGIHFTFLTGMTMRLRDRSNLIKI